MASAMALRPDGASAVPAAPENIGPGLLQRLGGRCTLGGVSIAVVLADEGVIAGIEHGRAAIDRRIDETELAPDGSRPACTRRVRSPQFPPPPCRSITTLLSLLLPESAGLTRDDTDFRAFSITLPASQADFGIDARYPLCHSRYRLQGWSRGDFTDPGFDNETSRNICA